MVKVAKCSQDRALGRTEWMKENPDNLDRTIFVSSDLANQFAVDFVAEFEITTTMPLYSVPGIDRL